MKAGQQQLALGCRAAGVFAIAVAVYGCAGHADRTQAARTALDAGRNQDALKLYCEELGVDTPEQIPDDIDDDDALLILDRAIILQALDRYDLSSRDLEHADKHVEALDFSRSGLDDVGKYMFTDDAGPYKAPPYEKLLINTMNMINYLVRGDLNGARVEARRLAVMQKFISEREGHGLALSGPGSYLAGFIFERSGDAGEALRYYDEALQYGSYESLRDPVRRLSGRDPYRSPRLRKFIGEEGQELAPPPDDDTGELMVIVSYGRVPPKIAKRIPIGLALTYAALYLSPAQSSKANYLAAQGLVTWVNFPTLGEAKGKYGIPHFMVSGHPMPLEGVLAVDAEAQRAWKKVEGAVIASAITRMITRVVAGEATRQATGGGVVGALLSLGTQATMTALDTPDTRSWATLPARIAFGRVRLKPGTYQVVLEARGVRKTQTIRMPAGGWQVLNLTALR